MIIILFSVPTLYHCLVVLMYDWLFTFDDLTFLDKNRLRYMSTLSFCFLSEQYTLLDVPTS